MAGSEKSCCVPRCGRTRKDETVLHSFPNPDQDIHRFVAWTHAVGSNVSSLDPQYVYKNRRVCHAHFEEKYLTWTRRLSPDAVPTLLLPGAVIARVPMMQITNLIENTPLNTIAAVPSTSTGGPLAGTLKKTSRCKNSPKFSQKRHDIDRNVLLKTLAKSQTKISKYASRLRKALKLSENKVFQNALKKFTTLAAMFTMMQFREIGKKRMGRRFTEPEKIMALSLYKRSPRAYRWLQNIFVLPSSMTLSRLIAQANLKPGLNENLFQQLKKSVEKMKGDAKLCILLYDEMSIAPHFDYNQRKDMMSGFVNNVRLKQKKIADHAFVFMIRGVLINYKQPVAYMFCSGSTNKIELASQIKAIIKKLHEVGLHVLATVCDQGTTNVGAINILIQETREKYLRNNDELRRDVFEVENKEVIPLYDPPHLIKGIRNNLMTKNLTCSIDGSKKVAKWEHIVKLYEEDPAYKGIRLIKKLTDQHINPDKFQKMKVKYATQVLSQKVGVTMGFLAERNILPAECVQTADIIIFFDELFDSLNGSFENSKKKSGKNLLTAVTPKSDHCSIWSKAKLILSTMKFINTDGKTQNKEFTVPTISNWLRTINNVEYLIDKLFNEYSIKSVWMRHFNQDPLENFFGLIRSHGCRNTNPTACSFESSFAALLINNLSGQQSPGSNCEEDTCHTVFKNMEVLFKNTHNEIPTTLPDFDFESMLVDFEQKKNNPRILATLQYVTGYIIKKPKRKIFKNCKKCENIFYDKDNSAEFLKIREFRKGKMYLTYPNNNLVMFFSKIQDISTYVLKNHSEIDNLRSCMKTLLHVELDLGIFKCDKHKVETFNYVLELSSLFFVCNWCRDVNKILNGSRLKDVDNEDIIKTLAFNIFNKRKHYKK